MRLPPPLVYLAGVLIGIGIHGWLWPLPIPIPGAARALLAMATLGSGVGVILASFQRFRHTGQDPKPWTSTPEIIANGIYRWTRNPMYVGLALAQAGLAVALANSWIAVLVVPVLGVVYISAVRHEEIYLERKFGDAYRAYRDSVRRWL